MTPAVALKHLQWNIGNFDVRLRLPGRGVHGLPYTSASASRQADLEHIARLIAAEAPDLITLQEMDVAREHHLRLADFLPGWRLAVVGELSPTWDRHTQAVYVRKGIEVEREGLPRWRGFQAVGVRARLPGGKRELGVVSTHSFVARKNTRRRVSGHRALAAWARETTRDLPLVVGGDFNFDAGPGGMHHWIHRVGRHLPSEGSPVSSDWEADCGALEDLAEVLKDLGAGSGQTAGLPRFWWRVFLPAAAPLVPIVWALRAPCLRSRLDYIWGSGHLDRAEARVLRVTGPGATGHPAIPRSAFPWMDHDPVVASFRLNGAP